MPLPASINDLSTTAGSNSPGGGESTTLTDDYLRYWASYIASLRDVVLSGAASLSTLNITYTGTMTGGTAAVNIGSGQFYKSAAGNIGIGTASPTSNGVTYHNVELRGTAGGGGFLYAGDSAAKSQIGYGGAAGGTVVYSLNTDPILIGVNNIQRLKIDANGNYTIANTLSAPSLVAASGVLYVENGALKFIGSSGTVTTLAVA